MRTSRSKQYEKIKRISRMLGNKKLEQWADMWIYTANIKKRRHKIWSANNNV